MKIFFENEETGENTVGEYVDKDVEIENKEEKTRWGLRERAKRGKWRKETEKINGRMVTGRKAKENGWGNEKRKDEKVQEKIWCTDKMERKDKLHWEKRRKRKNDREIKKK